MLPSPKSEPRKSPRRKFRRVAVLAKPGTPEGQRIAFELGSWLRARGVAVRFDENTAKAGGRKDGIRPDTIPPGTDLVIVAGGDGTLLSAARVAGPLGIPILGVNFGGLGFMTELQPEELYTALERVLAGEYEIEEREALRVRFRRGRKILGEHALLNDAVVTKPRSPACSSSSCASTASSSQPTPATGSSSRRRPDRRRTTCRRAGRSSTPA
jgi:NAD kinase